MVVKAGVLLILVAPCAGAWVEIRKRRKSMTKSESLPVRERGLKYRDYSSVMERISSLPVRERGLKS